MVVLVLPTDEHGNVNELDPCEVRAGFVNGIPEHLSVRRRSVFVDEQFAARIERAEADFMVAASRASAPLQRVDTFQMPLCGGFATYAGPQSPYNKVVGLGFDGVPTDAQLAAVEDRYTAVNAVVHVELSTLADPAVVERLTSRGYRLLSFEDVLVRDITSDLEDDLGLVTPDDVVVLRDDGSDPAAVRTWLEVVVEAALHPDALGVAQHEAFSRATLEQAELAGLEAGVRSYLATVEGTPAGGGGVRLADGIAQMAGAGTVPRFRRRGVQTALVAARLRDAAAAGCDLAVVTTQPGSQSQANMQRMGFDVGYTRAILVRDDLVSNGGVL